MRALARTLSFHRNQLQRLAERGELAKTPEGDWDVRQAARVLVERSLDPSKLPEEVRRAAASGPQDSRKTVENVMTARERWEHARAEERELKVAQLRGELIERAVAVEAHQRLGAQMKAHLLSWGPRSIPELARESGGDASRLAVSMDRLIRELLLEMGDLAFVPGSEVPTKNDHEIDP